VQTAASQIKPTYTRAEKQFTLVRPYIVKSVDYKSGPYSGGTEILVHGEVSTTNRLLLRQNVQLRGVKRTLTNANGVAWLRAFNRFLDSHADSRGASIFETNQVAKSPDLRALILSATQLSDVLLTHISRWILTAVSW
jgi:hypothetical protein